MGRTRVDTRFPTSPEEEPTTGLHQGQTDQKKKRGGEGEGKEDWPGPTRAPIIPTLETSPTSTSEGRGGGREGKEKEREKKSFMALT